MRHLFNYLSKGMRYKQNWFKQSHKTKLGICIQWIRLTSWTSSLSLFESLRVRRNLTNHGTGRVSAFSVKNVSHLAQVKGDVKPTQKDMRTKTCKRAWIRIDFGLFFQFQFSFIVWSPPLPIQWIGIQDANKKVVFLIMYHFPSFSVWHKYIYHNWRWQWDP